MAFPLSFIFLIAQILENLGSLRENQGEINKESPRLSERKTSGK